MKTDQKRDNYFIKIINDLKTPTIAQAKALGLFLDDSQKKLSNDEKDLIELTLNSCNYVLRLIETFNEVEKLNNTPIKLFYETFDISALTNEIIKQNELILRYQELSVTKKYQDEIIIHADKNQIKKVIENILLNSIKHAFKNSKINIKIDKSKNELVFEVKSNSPYIEDEAMSEIFEKYKTSKSKNNASDIGLGLYLSKEIIKAHYGVMIAKSFDENINIFGFSILNK